MADQRNINLNRGRPAAPRAASFGAARPTAQSAESRRAAARASNSRRRRKRKRRNTLISFIMLLLFVAIALITLSVTVLFNISKIEVTGSKKVDKNQIIAACGVSQGDNLFRLNIADIQNKVLGKILELDRVEIKRKLPSTLCISVQEEQAAYNIKQEDGRYLILSKNYRVMNTGLESPDESATILSGISTGDAEKGDFVELKNADGFELVSTIMQELENYKMIKIKEIDVSNPVNISINYDNKYKILIGAISGISYKLQFAKEVIGKNLDGSEKGVIDARKEGQLSFLPDSKVYAVSSASSGKNIASSDKPGEKNTSSSKGTKASHNASSNSASGKGGSDAAKQKTSSGKTAE